MKLLFDANLSRRIVPQISDLFPGSSHIQLEGLAGETPDESIWNYARENGFTIVTSDFDFVILAGRFSAPPKVVRFERMDYSTAEAADILRRNSVSIYYFKSNSDAVLHIRR